KLRVAMALAARHDAPNVPVTTILDCVREEFPSRAAISKATGWDHAVIATIDAYRSSPETYSFPRAEQFRSVVPKVFSNVRFVSSGSYELAERCPLLVADLRS
ncbi:MAG TPA: hypothetical protein VIX12_06880, partial [Candidatus Binataceae bacterium]